jgi:hypothetical protein
MPTAKTAVNRSRGKRPSAPVYKCGGRGARCKDHTTVNSSEWRAAVQCRVHSFSQGSGILFTLVPLGGPDSARPVHKTMMMIPSASQGRRIRLPGSHGLDFKTLWTVFHNVATGRGGHCAHVCGFASLVLSRKVYSWSHCTWNANGSMHLCISG